MTKMKEAAVSPFFRFRAECRDHQGNLKWTEDVRNTVVTAGKNFVGDTVFRGTSYTNALFMGLKGTGAVAAADTMASHAGWAEEGNYSGSNRKQLVFAAFAGGTGTSTAYAYAMTSTYTAAGMFITTGTVINGTVGTLYSAGDFAVTRTGGTGDTINVTPTVVFA